MDRGWDERGGVQVEASIARSGCGKGGYFSFKKKDTQLQSFN
jgi:hypothetical protein